MKLSFVILLLLFTFTALYCFDFKMNDDIPAVAAKTLFMRMYIGDTAVVDEIDWNYLMVYDVDYSCDYGSTSVREDFIRGFAKLENSVHPSWVSNMSTIIDRPDLYEVAGTGDGFNFYMDFHKYPTGPKLFKIYYVITATDSEDTNDTDD